MPETRIGLFPDVGVSWFLARTPGAIGRYLAATGATIGAADALYAGLADAYIDDEALPGADRCVEGREPSRRARTWLRFVEARSAHR